MVIEFENYLSPPRDTQRDRALATQVRQLPEEKRFGLIRQMIRNNLMLGLYLANSCLTRKSYLKTLLQQGLQEADASSIRFWLEALLPRLGFQSVVTILEAYTDNLPLAVDKALYWLPQFLPENDRIAEDHLHELERLVQSKVTTERGYVEPSSTTIRDTTPAG